MKETIEKYLNILGVDTEKTKDILTKIFKTFKIIPKQTTDVDEQIFLDMKFGFFTPALTEEEVPIYMFLWEWGLQNWKERTDEKMGPFEFMALEVQIWEYIRIRRMAIEEDKVDVSPETPGFMAEALWAKVGAGREKIWPKVVARGWNMKNREDEEEVEEEEQETTDVQMYRYGEEVMTEEEFLKWRDSLDEDKKVAMLGHVEPFVKTIKVEGKKDERTTDRPGPGKDGESVGDAAGDNGK